MPARVALFALAAVVALASAGFATDGVVRAQEAPIDVRVDLEPRRATLGDRVRMTVSVIHTDAVLITAEPPAPREGLTLVETVPVVTVVLDDGRLRSEFGFTFAAFELGTMQPGPTRVLWLHEDGRSGATEVAAPPFEVVSAVIGDASALRPLKPQAEYGEPPAAWVRPAIAGGAVAALLLVAALAVWLRRRRRPEPVTAPVVVAAGPEADARRALEELASSGTLQAGDFGTFYGTIAVVMRRYLEARFVFPATALTTSELDARMDDQGIERWQSRLAEGLLNRCDAAVYAGYTPDPVAADHDLTVAFEIIELSREQPAAEEPVSFERPAAGGNGASQNGAGR
ncbi:MAG: hypothetical protein F4X80_00050 [Chloroflexi bacterium]|nr:hypothetical protein [Chloroflexota bacterium]MYE31069.1 hypothetical protein [Chloroflexota bacterium]